MAKLQTLELGGEELKVQFVEQDEVKEGITCDIYSFVGDGSKDLAIVTVKAGFKTPLQRVLKGTETIEGFWSGLGLLTVRSQVETRHFRFPDPSINEVVVAVGEIMQWHADGSEDLVFYEVCTPPYEDGRFEDLAE